MPLPRAAFLLAILGLPCSCAERANTNRHSEGPVVVHVKGNEQRSSVDGIAVQIAALGQGDRYECVVTVDAHLGALLDVDLNLVFARSVTGRQLRPRFVTQTGEPGRVRFTDPIHFLPVTHVKLRAGSESRSTIYRVPLREFAPPDLLAKAEATRRSRFGHRTVNHGPKVITAAQVKAAIARLNAEIAGLEFRMRAARESLKDPSARAADREIRDRGNPDDAPAGLRERTNAFLLECEARIQECRKEIADHERMLPKLEGR